MARRTTENSRASAELVTHSQETFERTNQSLAEMVRNGRISRETAIQYCFRPDDLLRYL